MGPLAGGGAPACCCCCGGGGPLGGLGGIEPSGGGAPAATGGVADAVVVAAAVDVAPPTAGDMDRLEEVDPDGDGHGRDDEAAVAAPTAVAWDSSSGALLPSVLWFDG